MIAGDMEKGKCYEISQISNITYQYYVIEKFSTPSTASAPTFEVWLNPGNNIWTKTFLYWKFSDDIVSLKEISQNELTGDVEKIYESKKEKYIIPENKYRITCFKCGRLNKMIDTGCRVALYYCVECEP